MKPKPKMKPGGRGGKIYVGGVPGNRGGGRPRSEVREMSAAGYEQAIPGLAMLADLEVDIDVATYPHLADVSIAERIRAADVLAKNGAIQRIDITSGDKPIEGLSPAERTARLAQIIAEADGSEDPGEAQ